MMKWRAGEGKALVAAAEEAVAKATAGGGWDNDVVRDAAPHGALINDYIAPKVSDWWLVVDGLLG